MNLRYITCSDPREFNDIHEIIKLGEMSPRVEIAVQAHPSKMSSGMPRNEWFRELVHCVHSYNYDINLAVHVNREWCDEICRTGKIPQDLKEFFYWNTNFGFTPLIKRWQLNIPSETVPNVNYRALKKFFRENSRNEFIVQYNNNTKGVVEKLHDLRVRFSVLFDASGGRGISPSSWKAPLFSNVSQGYSGGLSPENIKTNLDKISQIAVMPMAYYDANDNVVHTMYERGDIWIDAEGRLKTDDRFDVARARLYIDNAEKWLAKQKQR